MEDNSITKAIINEAKKVIPTEKESLSKLSLSQQSQALVRYLFFRNFDALQALISANPNIVDVEQFTHLYTSAWGFPPMVFKPQILALLVDYLWSPQDPEVGRGPEIIKLLEPVNSSNHITTLKEPEGNQVMATQIDSTLNERESLEFLIEQLTQTQARVETAIEKFKQRLIHLDETEASTQN